MIFKERQKRAMDTMNHRNREYLEKMKDSQPEEEGRSYDLKPSLRTTILFPKKIWKKVICQQWLFRLCLPFYPLSL